MRVTANMATFPLRLETSLKVIEKIYNQVDELRIYLNEYEDVPDEYRDSKITTHLGEDLKSTGKLFWANNPDEYYFCIDDDIYYPKGYVQRTLSKLQEYDDDVIISHHGRKFVSNKRVKNYFKDVQEYFHFAQEVRSDSAVEVIGNGVSCWNTNRVHINWKEFTYLFMDDIFVSKQAHQQGIKRIIVEHEKGYLKPIEEGSQNALYDKYKNDYGLQTSVFNSVDWWK